MKKWKSVLALLLTVAMCLSLMSFGALASSEEPETAQTDASGETEASNEADTSGEASATSASIESYIGNQPILETHVYKQTSDNDNAATFAVKGYYVYDSSISPTDSYYDTDDYAGIKAYDLTDITGVVVENYDGSATSVTGVISQGDGTDLTLTLNGIDALEDNAAYNVSFELADGTVTDAAIVYVITYTNSQYETSQTLTFDGLDYSLDLTNYAMTQVTAQQYGGSQSLFTADDFEDTAGLDAEAKAQVNWYLNSAVTNSGDDWFTFGYDDDYLRLEAIHFIYKYFTIEAANGLLGFTGDANPVGGGVSEYKFFSANTTNLHAFIYEGTSFLSVADGSYTPGGFAILTDGIDTDATLLDGYATITGSDLMVMIYNALVTGYASLSEEGEAVQAALIEAADITDEDMANMKAALSAAVESVTLFGDSTDVDAITEPNLAAAFKLSAEEKIAALETYAGIKTENLGELTKGEAIAILCQLDGLQDYRDEFDNESISGNQKDALMDFFWSHDNWSTITLSDGTADYSVDARDVAGTASISGNSIIIEDAVWFSEPTTGDSDDAYVGEPADTALYIGDGINATLVNSLVVSSGNVRSDSEYKFGVGGGIVIHGKGTTVTIQNTDGGLNIIGAGNYSNVVNMAGGLYVGMGATALYENAQIFSYNQHPSNTCYSGAVIYHNTYMTGNSGRIFSTDFFGGYVILDSAVVQKSGVNMYLDETSTLLCVDSFLPGMSSANTGISQAYFQNCLIYNASSMFGFSNNTSMLDDVATGTIVNSDIHFNSGSCTIATVAREQKAEVTIVDSTMDMEEMAGGYIFNITGDEWYSPASLMVNLVGTDLPAEYVFVGGPHTYETKAMYTVSTGEVVSVDTEGTSLYINADENSSATLVQDMSQSYTGQLYSDKTTTYTAYNTGTIYVYDNAADEYVACTLDNAEALGAVEEDGTVTYTIGGVTVILITSSENASDEAGSVLTIEPGEEFIITETTSLSSLTIGEGASLSADDDHLLTITIDGVETDIEPGETYEGDIVLNVVDKLSLSGHDGSAADWAGSDYRAALYLDENGLNESGSALSAAVGYSFNAEEDVLTVGTITSEGTTFNGIIVNEGSHTIQDGTIILNGDGGNDFNGYGAAILITGAETEVIIDNVTVDATGLTRGALATANSAKVLVMDSTFQAHEGVLPDDYVQNVENSTGIMKAVPWTLGLTGNNRATNLLGNATSTYFNSYVSADGWGVLSADDASAPNMNVVNSTIYAGGECAYGLFGIGSGSVIRILGSEIDVSGLGINLTSGYLLVGPASTENLVEVFGSEEILASDAYDANSNTVITSGGSIMRVGNSTADIQPGTVFESVQTAIVSKGGSGVLNMDGVSVTADNGIIFQLMDSDDAGMDVSTPNSALYTSYTENDVEPVYIEGRDLTAANAEINIANMTLVGDFYNSSESYTTDAKYGISSSAYNMNVNFVSSSLEGVISASLAQHVDPDTGEILKTIDSWTQVGIIVNTVRPVINNGVNVTLTDGSVWSVTGDCYLSSLTVDESSQVIVPDGVTVTIDDTVFTDTVITGASVSVEVPASSDEMD